MQGNQTRSAAALITLLLLAHGSTAHGQAELLVAPADAPMYTLSNLRITDSSTGLHKIVAVDFQRTRAGKNYNGPVVLVGRTDQGPFELRDFARPRFDADSGVVLLDGGGPFNGLHNASFELWLQQPVFLSGKQQAYLVSNVLRKGTLNATTQARPLNAEEKKALADIELSRTPPAGLPPDHVAVTSLDQLVAGMPVMAGRNAKWEPAEVIDVRAAQKTVIVRYEKYPDDVLPSLQVEKWIAAAPDTLAKASSDPSSFKPSVKVLPGGNLVVPKDLVEVTADTPLAVGAPVRMEWAGQWDDLVIVALPEGDKVTVGWADRPEVWDKAVPRATLLISKPTLAALAKPEAVKKFGEELAAARSKQPNFGNRTRLSRSSSDGEFPASGKPSRGSLRRQSHYPIRIDLPKDAQLVTADMPIEKGTPLAANWGVRWHAVTVLEVNDDGTLHIHWNDYGDAWDGDISRDQLIIQNKTLRKLVAKSKAYTAQAKQLRTWTDASGSFTIDASFVKKSAEGVTLRRADGREVTLKLDQLSQADQAVVEKLAPAPKNPFEP